MNLKDKRLRSADLVPRYTYGSLLSIHTTKVQTVHVGRYNGVITDHFAQISDLQLNIYPKLNF